MRLLRPLAVLSLALGVAAPLCAQQGASTGPAYPKLTRQSQQQQPATHQEQKPLIRHVSVVRLPVSVRDSHGDLALDLGPEDFQVYDDGVLQHIEHFDVGGDPLAVVLVVENSSRVAPLLAGVRKTGIIFTETVMGANSKGAVISFDDAPHLVVPFTTNHDRIQKAISRLKPGDDGAHLYDALYRAVQMLEEQPSTHRRVIVAVSESYDNGSTLKLGSILRDAQLANISIYSLGLSTTAARIRTQPGQAAQAQIGPTGTFSRPGFNGVPQTPSTVTQNSGNANLLAVIETLVKMGVNLISPEALQAASAATGGDHVSTFHDRSIERGMDRIGGELHAEYTLAYEVAADATYGYHEITVKLSRPGYKLRTRPGYFLAPPEGLVPGGKQH